MAKLFPFRGYRYDSRQVTRLDDVVTQPYDKISPEVWTEYMRRHPNNIVRVIKNRNYEEAANYLRQWMGSDILRRDEVASFYPYQQTFEFQGQALSRLGFIGLVSLADGDTSVKGHERVLEGPFADRLNLMRATESNDGLIFTLYSDPSERVDQILSEFKDAHQPIVEVVDDYQVTHQLWQLSDPSATERIQEAARETTLYIADGHHRFKTALSYCEEASGKGWRPGDVESFDKRMVAVFNMESPGLKILPTHRAIRDLPDLDVGEFCSKLGSWFEIDRQMGKTELELAMEQGGTRIGMLTKDSRFSLLRLKEDKLDDPNFMPRVAGTARQLDVNLLHEGILDPLLGIGPAEVAAQKHVDYFRDDQELVNRVHDGKYQLAFFLNPTTLKQVRDISESGEKMPQKSTDFFPKLLTGLVLMKMEIDKG